MKPEFLAYLQAEAEAKKKSGIGFSYTGNLDTIEKWVRKTIKRWKRRKSNGNNAV